MIFINRLFIFLLRSSLPGAEESNEAGRDGISLSCIQHIVVYTAYNWPARRDAGEADDVRKREKPRLDDAQVGHFGGTLQLLSYFLVNPYTEETAEAET